VRIEELRAVFARRGIRREFEEQLALFVWGKVMGPNIVATTRPIQVSDDVLFVQVGGHAVAQEYGMMREAFLEKLNPHLPRLLKDIKFHVAALERPADPPTPPPDLNSIELPEPDQDQLKTWVEDVDDQTLKHSLSALIQTVLKAQRLKSGQAGVKQCPGCGNPHEGEETLCAFCRIEGRKG